MPSGIRPWSVPLALVLLGCPSTPDGSRPPDDSDTPDDSGTPSTGIEAEIALHVEDGPGDLDLSADGLLLIITRYGGDVLSWDPQSGAQDVVQHAIPDLEGVFRAPDDRLWAVTSDGQVEGSVGWIEHNDYEEIADRADDGTEMRGLDDLVLRSDGRLVAVDDIVAGLFMTDTATGSTSFLPLGVESPTALLVEGDHLVVASADGVHRVEGSTVVPLDARPARGLALWGETLLACNSDDGVFAVGGGVVGGAEVPSPRNLLAVGDTLYVSDGTGRDLYVMDLMGWEP